MSLIIVESPTKARTFNKILKGKNYYVFATLGHIRDLPSEELAINYDKNFKPEYKILKGREKVVNQLKKLSDQNDEIILASDLDREGESIAYHIAYTLGLIKELWPEFEIKNNNKTLKRITFHEITSKAIEEALANPGELRPNLIKAQQARRILDRIVGYELSPLLWKKMGKNWLSAGRVQTVALRLIVEREKEIRSFKQENYYQIYGNFLSNEQFRAKLIKKDGISYEQTFKIKLFDGEYQYIKTTISAENKDSIKKNLETDEYEIEDVKEETLKKYPPPPLTTSLLQQEAFSHFGFPSRMTMKLAQGLYERGLITYHRTDSFSLSSAFVFRAKDHIEAKFGKEYALEKPRGYRTKSKIAQEAHEAIRPTHVEKGTDEIFHKSKLTPNHRKIYQLIFNRALATQMKEAEVNQLKIFVKGDRKYFFESDFSQVVFDGFLKVLNPGYVESHRTKPNLKKSEKVKLIDLELQENMTQPPKRYNDASLIKTLEEKGIGRPSTYAPIISLIQDKSYIEKDGRYFKPTSLGEAISDYLSSAFKEIFNINFTASMEEDLDEIANGTRDITTELLEFYTPFKKELEDQKKDSAKIEVNEDTGEICPKCDKKLVFKVSRFGKFYGCSGYPDCKFTKPILKPVKGKNCPLCGAQVVVRYSKKKRRFYGCSSYPECKFVAFSFNEIK